MKEEHTLIPNDIFPAIREWQLTPANTHQHPPGQEAREIEARTLVRHMVARLSDGVILTVSLLPALSWKYLPSTCSPDTFRISNLVSLSTVGFGHPNHLTGTLSAICNLCLAVFALCGVISVAV